MIQIKTNFLDVDHNNQLYKWLTTNEYLDCFDATDTDKSDTQRRAFSITYDINNVPVLLRHYVTDEYNVYNFVGIITETSGDIPEHVDDDLVSYMRSINIPEILIKYPKCTDVYYVDICEDMSGGCLIHENKAYQPQSNMLVTFSSNDLHAVTAVESLSRPRVVLVCEKYKLLSRVVDILNTPVFRSG